jgi:hypothetical protein
MKGRYLVQFNGRCNEVEIKPVDCQLTLGDDCLHCCSPWTRTSTMTTASLSSDEWTNQWSACHGILTFLNIAYSHSSHFLTYYDDYNDNDDNDDYDHATVTISSRKNSRPANKTAFLGPQLSLTIYSYVQGQVLIKLLQFEAYLFEKAQSWFIWSNIPNGLRTA